MNPSDSDLVSSANTPGGKDAVRQGAESKAARTVPRTAEEIQDWFVRYLSEALQIPSEKIELKAPFEVLGLDSVTAVGMSGDLETWLGCSIDPMVVYDYPTIESLAGYLAEHSQSARPAP
jgi:acyl carrier protein